MQSQLQRTILGILALVAVVSAWLWISAEDYEQLSTEPEFTVPERFKTPNTDSTLSEDDLPEYTDEPPLQHGWIVPPEPVRKAVGKVKRRIKQKDR